MGLFSRKKEDDISQHIQNLEIKQATANNNIPLANFPNSNEMHSEESFVNPFQQDMNQNLNLNQNNQVPKTSNFYQKQNLDNDFTFNNGQNNQYSNFNLQNQIQQQSPEPNFQANLNQNMQNNNSNFNTNQQNSNLNHNNTNSNTIFSNQNGLNLQAEVQKQNNLTTKDEIQEMIDETIEKLLEEKWESLVDNVGKIANWKEKQEADVKQLKDDLLIIKDNFEKIEKKFNSRLTDYDKNILDVNSEIKALEKVFQKITPTLVNNVNELSKIADNLRGLKINNSSVQNNSNQLQDQSIQRNNSRSLLE